MENRLSFSGVFLLAITVASFMLGTIIGSIITYIIISISPLENTTAENLFAKKENKIYESIVPVKEVLDGDTIVIKLKDKDIRVKYLGIDAPEEKKGNNPVYFAKEALKKNKELLDNKKIKIVWESRYQTGSRLLAYVYQKETFVNAELVRKGYASIYRRTTGSSKHKYSAYFEMLEAEAQANKLGIWNLEKKWKWEQEHQKNYSKAKTPYLYIGDSKYFHRPECPKVKNIKFKIYYYSREYANRAKLCCPICNP